MHKTHQGRIESKYQRETPERHAFGTGAFSRGGASRVRAEPALESAVFEAPEGCSIAEPIAREVERLLRPTRTASKPPELKLAVFQQASGRFRLVIETRDADKGLFQRELEAADCHDFIRPAAVVIALAIDPEALAISSRSENLEAGATPAKPPLQPPEPSSGTRVPATAPAQRSWSRLAIERRTVRSIPTADRVIATRESPSSKARRVVPFVRATAVMDVGALPAPSLGPALAVGIDWRLLRVMASGMYLPERRATVSGNPEKGGDISLISAALSACVVPFRTRVELGGCLGSEVGVLRGDGFGVTDPESGSGTWFAAKAGALVGYSPRPMLAAVFHAEAIRRIGNSEFELQGLGRVHQPADWGVRVDLAWSFDLSDGFGGLRPLRRVIAAPPETEDIVPRTDATSESSLIVPSFAELYRDHFDFAWLSLRRLGVPLSHVNDATQELFLVVHRRLDGFEGRSSIRTWIFSIAIRIANQHRRTTRRRPSCRCPTRFPLPPLRSP